MNNKLRTEKFKLLDETFEELNKNYPRGMYVQMEVNFPGLEERFNQAEKKINSLVKNGTIVELKKALEGFWYLHQELLGQVESLKLKQVNHPTPKNTSPLYTYDNTSQMNQLL